MDSPTITVSEVEEPHTVHHCADAEDYWSQRTAAAEAGQLVVVDFTATWCGPCQRIKPALACFADEFRSVRFIAVDVDALDDVAAEAGVRSLPTFHLYDDAKLVGEMTGARESVLRSTIVDALSRMLSGRGDLD